MMNTIKRCWVVGLAYTCCCVCNGGRTNRHIATAFVSSTRSYQPSYNTCLKLSSFDIDVPSSEESGMNKKSLNQSNNNHLLMWKDILPISLFTTICLVGAVIISTYEDYDVTHVRPSPSTLRLPTDITSSSIDEPMTSDNKFNFIGAATKGMGSGKSDRLAQTFDDWYGTSATTLQDVRGYNEIMLEHRRETIPRWIGQNAESDNLGLMGSDTSSRISFATSTKEARSYSKEELQDAVLQLYKSLGALDNLKTMSDDYMWEEIKDMLQPSSTVSGDENTLRQSFESLEVLKSAPLYYKSITDNNNQQQLSTTDRNNVDQLPELIGFDWGSCAWRHCGAKADAQEALAELYTSVGMLEPFECRFIIDIMERSIRDVLLVVPDDLRPTSADGRMVELKPYEPYMSQSEQNGGDESFEYVNALNSLREVFE
mmetsp:Transcript_3616/g.5495  ORF Transcript_3616/g.5495 Transcript_3616/m.5495 type:complete len:428 (-) Transcript_3616:101-1384(-)